MPVALTLEFMERSNSLEKNGDFEHPPTCTTPKWQNVLVIWQADGILGFGLRNSGLGGSGFWVSMFASSVDCEVPGGLNIPTWQTV